MVQMLALPLISTKCGHLAQNLTLLMSAPPKAIKFLKEASLAITDPTTSLIVSWPYPYALGKGYAALGMTLNKTTSKLFYEDGTEIQNQLSDMTQVFKAGIFSTENLRQRTTRREENVWNLLSGEIGGLRKRDVLFTNAKIIQK